MGTLSQDPPYVRQPYSRLFALCGRNNDRELIAELEVLLLENSMMGGGQIVLNPDIGCREAFSTRHRFRDAGQCAFQAPSLGPTS
jgi:hypothetical protein